MSHSILDYYNPHQSRLPNPKFFIPFVLIMLLLVLFITKGCAEEIDICIPCIIKIESNGNPNAISKDGCIGLMQIHPIVLKEFNIINGKQVFNTPFGKPNTNIQEQRYLTIADLYNSIINYKIGIWYLDRIKNHYLPYYKIPVTIENILISYNWGIGNLVKWYKQGAKFNRLPKETKNYILRYYKELAKQ